jgi:hypothetical protein
VTGPLEVASVSVDVASGLVDVKNLILALSNGVSLSQHRI